MTNFVAYITKSYTDSVSQLYPNLTFTHHNLP